MRTKKEIMENVWDKCNCDTLEQMQGGLIVELLCDIRDTMKGSFAVKTEYIEGDELPWRIEIDELNGVGISPSKAVMAALSAGHKIPPEWRQ